MAGEIIPLDQAMMSGMEAGATKFYAIVDASRRVAGTRSRRAKIATIAELLRVLRDDELDVAIGFLTGEPRQGRIGVGWATIRDSETPPAQAPVLTVREIDAELTALQATTGGRSVAARKARLVSLFARATEPEADFLRRLIIGELRQGALEGIMADAIAAANHVPIESVRRAAMLTGSLGEVAELVRRGGRAALDESTLTMFQPVLPMLAGSSPTAGEAIAACGLSSVEYKLDGARIQVHRSGDDVRIYTRNLNEVTARLPDVVTVALALGAREFIVDGEVLGFADDDRPHAFQDTMSHFSTDNHTERPALVPFFFDCLHADGVDCLDRPLRERIEVLDRIASGRTIPRIVTDAPDLAQAMLDDSISAGHEGVMVKALDSRYEAGRRGQSWRKVKPVHTFDLVVLAAEWGHGRRRGWLSNLHLGARAEEGSFVMVGKTFKGLTDELLRWQTEALLAREVAREGIVVHVRPELVIEIALDGVQVSRRYAGGVAMRFARVRRYRPDKAPSEADTIDSLRALLPR
jgi:DNA ligase-1